MFNCKARYDDCLRTAHADRKQTLTLCNLLCELDVNEIYQRRQIGLVPTKCTIGKSVAQDRVDLVRWATYAQSTVVKIQRMRAWGAVKLERTVEASCSSSLPSCIFPRLVRAKIISMALVIIDLFAHSNIHAFGSSAEFSRHVDWVYSISLREMPSLE